LQIDVLDHGFVRLISAMGSDLSIVRAARVSYNADWRTGEDEGKDEKLIAYLMKNRHTSPFEAVVFTFEVKAPIFVFRQWHRHRTWSYNEVSARYTELDEGFYVPDPDKVGRQIQSTKQAREITGAEPKEAIVASGVIRGHCEESFERYRTLLGIGVPRELARSVLPVAAYSRMFATVDLHNLMGFLRLRLNLHAQYEIKVYAQALREIAGSIVPCAMRAFDAGARA
jgi:thymidylate synthase (FAD)